MPDSVALVHDYLTQRGGAERVVAAWCDGFPEAPLYTSLYEPTATFPSFQRHDVRTSWLNHLAALRRNHRLALPLLAPTMSHWRIDADVVIASSSGWRTECAPTANCWSLPRTRPLAIPAGSVPRGGFHGPSSTDGSLDSRPDPARLGPASGPTSEPVRRQLVLHRDLVRTLYGRDADVIAPPVALPELP